MNTRKNIRILFMGSDELACPTLERLLAAEGLEVVAAVTQPDRPSGRSLRVQACPLKQWAEEAGVPVLAPEKVGAEASVAEIETLAPDLIVVAAYGQYIKPAILRLPRLGAINLHPSLLPKYRGAAPIQMAVANGEEVTGVSVIHVAEKMDAGDIVMQEVVSIDPDDTAETLAARLAHEGADLMLRAIDALASGTAPRIPQDESAATYVSKLKKEDGYIDWSQPAEVLRNRIRGLQPWPGCSCADPAGSGGRLKIFAARVEDAQGPPGAVLACDQDGPLVACGEKALRLLRVQPPGKKPMDGAAYLCGHRGKVRMMNDE